MNTTSAPPKAPDNQPAVDKQLPAGKTCAHCLSFGGCSALGITVDSCSVCQLALWNGFKQVTAENRKNAAFGYIVDGEPAKRLNLIIDHEGNMRFIYDDTFSELLDEGKSTIERASHVEPEGTQWIADLAPMGGPKLGPFAKRQEALDAEVAWLIEHVLV